MNELYLRYRAISIFSDAARAIAPLAELLLCDPSDEMSAIELASRVFSLTAESGSDTTGEWIVKLLHADDNVFSRAAAMSRRISDRIKTQVEAELLTFKQLSLIKPELFRTERNKSYFPRFGSGGMTATFDGLVSFYAANGCGAVACASAFTYRNGELLPLATDDVRLSDIKNYAEEKAEIVKNTENFIAGRPAFHALLYGDRGTGKSTTVRAVANEYRGKLKIIEITRGDVADISLLKARLSGLDQKFILFVDDLVFDEDDKTAEDFKTALEGSLDAPQGNTLLYCTSNRRHLFKETDKTDLRHRNDEVQAELALFDRFGLVITYINPDRDEFIDILKQILRSRSIKWRDEYASIAELAALKKGGRTPRAAKQIADLIESTYVDARSD